MGRPSIPPEQLLRALLLQHLYSIRSERLLIEQRDGVNRALFEKPRPLAGGRGGDGVF